MAVAKVELEQSQDEQRRGRPGRTEEELKEKDVWIKRDGWTIEQLNGEGGT